MPAPVIVGTIAKEALTKNESGRYPLPTRIARVCIAGSLTVGAVFGGFYMYKTVEFFKDTIGRLGDLGLPGGIDPTPEDGVAVGVFISEVRAAGGRVCAVAYNQQVAVAAVSSIGPFQKSILLDGRGSGELCFVARQNSASPYEDEVARGLRIKSIPDSTTPGGVRGVIFADYRQLEITNPRLDFTLCEGDEKPDTCGSSRIEVRDNIIERTLPLPPIFQHPNLSEDAMKMAGIVMREAKPAITSAMYRDQGPAAIVAEGIRNQLAAAGQDPSHFDVVVTHEPSPQEASRQKVVADGAVRAIIKQRFRAYDFAPGLPIVTITDQGPLNVMPK